jgi:hypothetical protein
MAACRPVIFKNVSRRKFKAVRARIYAQADTTRIDGDTGSASGFGYTAEWTYNEAEQTLAIQCTDKPFFVPEGLVIGKIQALVEGVEL